MSQAPPPPPPPPPHALVMQVLFAKFHSRIIGELCRANVFDHMSGAEPKGAAELASATGLNQDALYRCLRALTMTPIVVETPDHRFQLTAAGECLQDKSPTSFKGMALYIGSAWHGHWWAELGHTLKTGGSSATKVCGKNVFQWFQENPKEFAEFQAAMDSISRPAAPAVATGFDFTPFKVICDVGGGHGELLSAILDHAPDSRGILFDLPQVIEQSAAIVQTHSAASRVTKVAGDMFESVPSNVDLFLTKHIIHDWSDDHCVKILENMKKNLNPGGRIITVDHVVAPPMHPDPSKMIDVEMLAATEGGRERTESEFRQLYSRAGLSVVEIRRTKSPLCLIIGAPA